MPPFSHSSPTILITQLLSASLLRYLARSTVHHAKITRESPSKSRASPSKSGAFRAALPTVGIQDVSEGNISNCKDNYVGAVSRSALAISIWGIAHYLITAIYITLVVSIPNWDPNGLCSATVFLSWGSVLECNLYAALSCLGFGCLGCYCLGCLLLLLISCFVFRDSHMEIIWTPSFSNLGPVWLVLTPWIIISIIKGWYYELFLSFPVYSLVLLAFAAMLGSCHLNCCCFLDFNVETHFNSLVDPFYGGFQCCISCLAVGVGFPLARAIYFLFFQICITWYSDWLVQFYEQFILKECYYGQFSPFLSWMLLPFAVLFSGLIVDLDYLNGGPECCYWSCCPNCFFWVLILVNCSSFPVLSYAVFLYYCFLQDINKGIISWIAFCTERFIYISCDWDGVNYRLIDLFNRFSASCLLCNYLMEGLYAELISFLNMAIHELLAKMAHSLMFMYSHVKMAILMIIFLNETPYPSALSNYLYILDMIFLRFAGNKAHKNINNWVLPSHRFVGYDGCDVLTPFWFGSSSCDVTLMLKFGCSYLHLPQLGVIEPEPSLSHFLIIILILYCFLLSFCLYYLNCSNLSLIITLQVFLSFYLAGLLHITKHSYNHQSIGLILSLAYYVNHLVSF